MRLIDADELEFFAANHCSDSERLCILDVVEKLPTIDAEPVRHGRWITSEMTIDTGCTSCSCCRSEYYIGDLQALEDDDDFVMFCPHCGAKMDQEDNP